MQVMCGRKTEYTEYAVDMFENKVYTGQKYWKQE